MTDLFGVPIIGKSTGTRRVGAQPIAPSRQALSTALENVSRQQSMNSQPDPSLGAPFSSFPNNRLTVAQMGPGEPAENFPLGAEPRQWKYRVGWNFPTTPDTDRGINGQLLRQLADSAWILRRCIEVRKHEMAGLDWEIVARGRNGKERRLNGDKHAPLIDKLTEFLRYPESYYSFATPDEDYDPALDYRDENGDEWQRRPLVDWGDWFSAVLEDQMVGDWVSVWPQRTVGNEVLGLRRVDGEHIKALLDLDGRIPPPPMPAWQQYLYGVPRGSWAADEFYYLPRNVRNMTPYGFSPVQQGLVVWNLAMRYDMWNTAAYTEGRVPMGLLETPEGLPVDQIQDIADFLNGASNSLATRQMVHPVPAGTTWQPIQPFVFSPDYAMYVIEIGCALFGVSPQELGFAPARSGLGGAGFADGQNEVARRKGLIPLARWWERKLTRILNEQWRNEGGDSLEFRFTDIVAEDAAAKYQSNQIAIMSGQESIDNILEEDGQDAPGIGHIMMAGTTLLFLDKKAALVGGQVVALDLDHPQPYQPPPSPFGAKPGEEKPGGGKPGDALDGGPNHAEPQGGKKPERDKATKAASSERKQEEELFLGAWLRWWKAKAQRAASLHASDPVAVHDAFKLTPDEQTELSHMLYEDLREPLYTNEMNRLREEAGLPQGPWASSTRSDILREQTLSQTHIVQIIQTYHTDLEDVYQKLTFEFQTNPDRQQVARLIEAEIVKWAIDHSAWKGEQIAATEGTDAIAKAKVDFTVQNPKILREWRWKAKMDQRTCDACANMNGQVIDPAQGPYPPAHVNCRCELYEADPNARLGPPA